MKKPVRTKEWKVISVEIPYIPPSAKARGHHPQSPDPGSPAHATSNSSQRHNGIATLAADDVGRGDATYQQASLELLKLRDKMMSDSSSVDTQESEESTDTKLPLQEVHPADIALVPGFCLLREPPIEPSSQEYVVSEVVSIYDVLKAVEDKCVSVISSERTKISDSERKHYELLICLHRTLLGQHHNLLLACQHPTNNDDIRTFPTRHILLLRMWQHDIQSFLEFLRKRLPASGEYLRLYISIAYNTFDNILRNCSHLRCDLDRTSWRSKQQIPYGNRGHG
ncbi:hypothetical protein ARSEF1564_010107 [Beauveria bassiana]